MNFLDILKTYPQYFYKKSKVLWGQDRKISSLVLGVKGLMGLFSVKLFQSESDKKLVDKVNKLVAILGGETTIALHLEFLIRNNHADLLILKNTKVGDLIWNTAVYVLCKLMVLRKICIIVH